MAARTSHAFICTIKTKILFLKRPHDVTFTIVLNINVIHYVLCFSKTHGSCDLLGILAHSIWLLFLLFCFVLLKLWISFSFCIIFCFPTIMAAMTMLFCQINMAAVALLSLYWIIKYGCFSSKYGCHEITVFVFAYWYHPKWRPFSLSCQIIIAAMLPCVSAKISNKF